MKIAINGFGRIGRNITRLLANNSDFELITINTLGPSDDLASYCAYLLKYDSVQGNCIDEIGYKDGTVTIGRQQAKITSFRNPADCDWSGIDLVLECTGCFTSREAAKLHLAAGAKAVLVSAPGKDLDATIVYGVNHHMITADTKLLSNASCTTNALAPVVKVLDDLAGVEHGLMNTIHAVTGDQALIDGMHKDWRRGRAAMDSMIPTGTGAARAIGDVLPHLKGKLDGFAIRVPTNNVSVIDLTITLKTQVSVAEINAAMESAAANSLKGVLAVTKEQLVSVDFLGNPASATFDLSETRHMGPMYKCLIWYDNEAGFAHRMLNTAKVIGGINAV